jgi:hypothetical protein
MRKKKCYIIAAAVAAVIISGVAFFNYALATPFCISPYEHQRDYNGTMKMVSTCKERVFLLDGNGIFHFPNGSSIGVKGASWGSIGRSYDNGTIIVTNLDGTQIRCNTGGTGPNHACALGLP